MKRNLLAVAMFVVLGGATGAFSAAPVQFDHITAEDGLPNNWVQAVIKDSRGFLWIGTQEGLVRYDAGAFVSYRRQKSNPDGLPFSAVRLIFEDSRKDIWVGSYTGAGGLARLDATTGRFQIFMPDGTNGVDFFSRQYFAMAERPRLIVEVTPVPEPQTWLLVIAGLVAAGAAARRARPARR